MKSYKVVFWRTVHLEYEDLIEAQSYEEAMRKADELSPSLSEEYFEVERVDEEHECYETKLKRLEE